MLLWLLSYLNAKNVWWPGLKEFMVDPQTLAPNEIFGESFGLVVWVFCEALAGSVGLAVLWKMSKMRNLRYGS